MGKMEMSKGKALRNGKYGRQSRFTELEFRRIDNSPRRKNWIHFMRRAQVRALHPTFEIWLTEQRFGEDCWREFTRLPFSILLNGWRR